MEMGERAPSAIQILSETDKRPYRLYQRSPTEEGHKESETTKVSRTSVQCPKEGLGQKTSPFLWYWYSALPRALGLSLPLIPVGLVLDKRVRVLATPAIIFVTAYSFLPHKELRFIIYVIPLLNVAAARACHYLWEGREKSGIRQVFALGAALHLLANVSFTTLLLTISANNYPGGLAIHKLHEIVPPETFVNVHIDNYAAQTGVSRFTQLYDHWKYNKTEKLKAGGQAMRSFTHILVEAKTKYSYNLKHYTTSHEILNHVEAFSHLSFNYQQFPPVKVRAKPAIFLLQNTIEEHIDWSFLTNDKTKLDKETVEQHPEDEIEESVNVQDELGHSATPKDITDEDRKEVFSEFIQENEEEEEKVEEEEGEKEEEEGKKEEEEGKKEEDKDNHEQPEHVLNTVLDEMLEEPQDPSLPDVGCFAPEEESEVLVTENDPGEEEFTDKLFQSSGLDLEETIVHEKAIEAEPDIRGEERNEEVCYDCSSTEDENIEVAVTENSDSDIVNYQASISSDKDSKEIDEKQTAFVEVASVLEEELEGKDNIIEEYSLIDIFVQKLRKLCWNAFVICAIYYVGMSIF
ncbi:uncharacterized protein LOC135215886 [Macrobrachium nipponense]|uniref:uncharacterized protein LOC135215886 n=1 Tax=Macrobrachium nipponense TaxID=159736 RepID=UPI0030C83DC5